jgi:hypothetical protein
VDTREFVRLQQPSDFSRLENYVDSVDPSGTGLKRVIHPYHLRTYMRCSLTTCHQEHHDGYLVELTRYCSVLTTPNVGIVGTLLHGQPKLRDVSLHRRVGQRGKLVW